MSRTIKKTIVILLFLLGIVYLFSILIRVPPTLKGFYQSEWISCTGTDESQILQISIWENGGFVEYITNRCVNQGSYEGIGEGKYHFDGDEIDFDIYLRENNSFEIQLAKLNNGNSIQMQNISNIPCTFGTGWTDAEEFKSYLHK